MDQAAKERIAQHALRLGILKDPQWLHKLDEPMPAWVVMDMIINMLEKLDPPGGAFD
ncbi:MAG: hypothetical protein K0Q59_4772 [Paenibacillus sp.]|jgi:hypothetical protein|nr:hypothetical protein [Paenibacillus sp.]